jgi:hypothetical protein
MSRSDTKSTEGKQWGFRRHEGTTRVVFLIGKYAIKLPALRSWKLFLRGILANLDENLWYKSSPAEWKLKMCPVVFSFVGFILIARRARPIPYHIYEDLDLKQYEPLPVDPKQSNFGWYDHRIVLIDYADSRYFCSECEELFKHKTQQQ